ncbi:hypothetical protein AB838_16750 [Rhodobacteraceae bacterium (ex Bugula neritina AB1)]|nr:hypothetical protein AB838_16750 [Rhodobacteraceae bacterium (ex Bugula neritina AB1)]
MKLLFGMTLLETNGFVENPPHLVGFDWVAPDFNTLSRRQKTLAAPSSESGVDTTAEVAPT